MYYPEEVIEEVRMRSDIVDVISGYVKLQKKGSNLFGLCPFHHEKSPSFSVSPSKQMYHCFGCGVSGNVITFVMEYENYSFREAVEMLADRSGVKLPKMEYSKEAKAKADRKAALLEINKLAVQTYRALFHLVLNIFENMGNFEFLKILKPSWQNCFPVYAVCIICSQSEQLRM